MNHKTWQILNAAHRHTRNLMGVAICIALMVLFAGRAMAQLDQGAIIGVVQDSTGAVIPNADVTLTAVDTGLVLKTKSNESGNYFFAPIKIGNYTVSASAAAFIVAVVSPPESTRSWLALSLKP